MIPERPASDSRRTIVIAATLVLGLGLGLLVGEFRLQMVGDESGRRLAELESDLADIRGEVSALRQSLLELNLSSPGSPQFNASSGYSSLYLSVRDSVVSIVSRFGSGTSVQTGEGSGFVYDFQGHIITNNHVVEGASRIGVRFLDGDIYPARVVGTDIYSDLAVLEIEAPAERVSPLVLGDSSQLQVGTPVVAIGNPFGLAGSMSVGIVSQVGRTLPAAGRFSIPNVIQIDAAINPGNSGGPVLTLDGRVVGITTAIASPTGAFSGVGFAIPSNTVSREVPVLIQKGSYEHPWLGASGLDVDPLIKEAMNLQEARGWMITELVQGGPAEMAGLREGTRVAVLDGNRYVIGGDVIISIAGRQVSTGDDVSVILEEYARPGDTVKVEIIRDGKVTELQVTVGVRPLPP